MLRLKTELKNIRDSDLGKLVDQDKKAQKRGEQTSSEFSDSTLVLFQLLEEMKNVLNEWIETGKKPIAFNQIVDGTHPMILEGQKNGTMPMSGDDNMFSMFGDDNDGNEDMSEDDLMEMLAFLTMMEGGGAPKKNKTRRKR